MIRRPLLAALAILMLVPFPGRAQETPLTTRYSVSLIGLPVGRAHFRTTISGDRYSVSGDLASAGLAALVSRVDGTSSVSGRIRRSGLAADRYSLAYTADGKSWSSDVAMRNGAVTSSQVAPRREETPPADFVPVSRGQLRSVVDPLSGLMIRAEPENICNRTLPLYDGWSRLDLRMSDGGRRAFSATGFSGDAVVCNVTISPVSGYRRGSRGLRFLEGQTLQIWFAPVRQTGIHAPVYARIPTQVGPLTLTATVFAAP
ncbi:DUF3108 domain-containing protein [Aureimonas mangrovi]|uniref:DUF3108 domain-containing protein n=1 Tax=Aureimonas mangrovi TaxID=2758041 RepID=UPI00163D851C|nr:DUF3108 domain-containing protein [Aureimonas mangrovi]